mmetsp:Transcript_42682/g.134608  ORF Transcript_42682/g.134608 Transcript_42682/m.134608 type:complete len:103 (+) Transcript_42682:3-311(+)
MLRPCRLGRRGGPAAEEPQARPVRLRPFLAEARQFFIGRRTRRQVPIAKARLGTFPIGASVERIVFLLFSSLNPGKVKVLAQLGVEQSGNICGTLLLAQVPN